MSGSGHIAAADCERCRDRVIAQPVNTASSLAFCIAGLVVVARSKRRGVSGDAASCGAASGDAEAALGWSSVAAGLGSVAYHGPGTRVGQVLHDGSLLTMLTSLIAADVARATGRSTPRIVLGSIPIVSVALAATRFSLGAQVLTGAGAVAAEVVRVRRDRLQGRRGWRPAAEAAIAALGATGHVAGRTGGPLCRPDSVWQAHAGWHTSMATVLVLRD